MRGLVIAGTHSGCGKTTITLGILAALKKRGLNVQSFKAGPDFIDSGLHKIITGRHSRNLDIWMCGEKYVKDCFLEYSTDADISIVEGVMGMYDGEYSTAKLAGLLNLPVILVLDAYGMAESAGAVIKGFLEYSNEIQVTSKELKNKKNSEDSSLVTRYSALNLAGIIFNRVGSERHYERLKKSIRDVDVLGYLPRDLNFEIPHRHLGLAVAEENPIDKENIEKLADAVLEHMDVDAMMDYRIQDKNKAHHASCIGNHASAPSISIAVAYDKAFCFYYEDNLDLLKDAGAEIIAFSPLSANEIPAGADAVYIGGGYPELYAEELSQNISLLKSFKEWSDADKPVYAECGGLMYLAKGIHDFNGNFFKMAGVFPFETQMKKGRAHLGYREIELTDDCLLGKKGDRLRGHEFHYSEIKPSALVESGLSPSIAEIYSVINNHGELVDSSGYKFKNTLASYVHVHFGSNPGIAQNFINFIMQEN